MPKKATAADAEVILKLYELRREPEMRKARNWWMNDFWPQQADDFINMAKSFPSQENQWMRQVATYWEMAATMVLSGAVNEQLFLHPSCSGELFFCFAKVLPHLKEFREKLQAADAFENIERVVMKPSGAVIASRFFNNAKSSFSRRGQNPGKRNSQTAQDGRMRARDLSDVLANVLILGMREFVGIAVKNHFPLTQDQKAGANIGTAAGWQRLHVVRLGIEAMRRQDEGILQTMSHEQRTGVIGIALLQDQFDDGRGRYRIEPAGGRVIEQDFRLRNDCPRDGDSPAHAARELGRKSFHRVLQLDEAEHFLHPTVYFLVRNFAFFDQAERDIIANTERVKQCALLKHNANFPAQLEKFFLFHPGDVLTEHENAA
jgi:hypothetical protein